MNAELTPAEIIEKQIERSPLAILPAVVAIVFVDCLILSRIDMLNGLAIGVGIAASSFLAWSPFVVWNKLRASKLAARQRHEM